MTGNRPQKIELLKANSDSPLVIGAKMDDEKTDLAELGETRTEGGMSNRAFAAALQSSDLAKFEKFTRLAGSTVVIAIPEIHLFFCFISSIAEKKPA